MTSPAREIQGLLYTALTADAALMGVATKVYDRVSGDAVFPYVSFGPVNSVPFDATCITASEHTVQIDTWSTAVGSGQSYDMTDRIKRVVQSASVQLTTNAMTNLRVTSVRHFEDGSDEKHLIERGVVTIQAMIEEK